jgi:hypothetical protein
LKKSPPAPKAREETKAREEMDEGRREVMRKLGVYGAYTAPALIALLKSGKAAANSLMSSLQLLPVAIQPQKRALWVTAPFWSTNCRQKASWKALTSLK